MQLTIILLGIKGWHHGSIDALQHFRGSHAFVLADVSCSLWSLWMILAFQQAMYVYMLEPARLLQNFDENDIVSYSFGVAAQRGLWLPYSRRFQTTHNDSPQSVGLLWTSDQLVAETSIWQHTTFTTDRHPYPRWDSNLQSQQASGHGDLSRRI